MKIEVGDICWTPFEPRTQVRVISIWTNAINGRLIADVEFLSEHYGYPAGSEGCYAVDELELVEGR
jgi:hypothetical protein